MKRLIVTLCWMSTLLCAHPLYGQAAYEKAKPYGFNNVFKLSFTREVEPIWTEGSDLFIYEYKTTSGTRWYLVDPVAGTKKPLFDQGNVAGFLSEILRQPCEGNDMPIDDVHLKDAHSVAFVARDAKYKRHDFEYDLESRKLREVESPGRVKRSPRWASVSPDGNFAVFARDYNLYWVDKENLDKLIANEGDESVVEHPLTTDGVRGFSYGEDDGIKHKSARNDSKRLPPDIVWSPDSKHFAFVKVDKREVKELWVIDATADPRPELIEFKYKMPGEDAPTPETLMIFDMETGIPQLVNATRFKDQELRFINNAWVGDDQSFYLYRQSRDFKKIDLCRATIGQDTLTTLVEERLDSFLESKPPVLVEGGKEFIHWSERSGWGHLYLYDSNGKLKNAVTAGEYHVDRIVKVDAKSRVVYFTANGREPGENPYYRHFYRVNFDGSGLKLLNPGNFTHDVRLSRSGKFFVDNYSRVDTAPASALYAADGRKILDLEETDLSLLFETGYKFPEPFTVKAADGVTDLYGVMYKPFDFDSTKSYPIIEYVYPGPQTEHVNFAWRTVDDDLDRLAQLGFIVITVGNRGGSPDRSKWYHNYGYGNLRDYALADKKVAAERLAARYPFIDISRVGIHGHSGGGNLTAAAVLSYPDFFKVGVAASGNHDNTIYNRYWGEKYQGVEEQIFGQDTTFSYSVMTNPMLASNLEGHLLIVTGDIDNNVNPAHAYRLAQALIRANKDFDLLVMPGMYHDVDCEYLFWKKARYFSRYLLGDVCQTADIVP